MGGTIEKMSVCSALIKAYFFDKLGFLVKMQLTRAIGNETLIFLGLLFLQKNVLQKKSFFNNFNSWGFLKVKYFNIEVTLHMDGI